MDFRKEKRMAKDFQKTRVCGRVKICGIVRPEDAHMAVRAGAAYIGCIVGFNSSPRHVSLARAREIQKAAGDQAAVVWVVDEISSAILQAARTTGVSVLHVHRLTADSCVRAHASGMQVWQVVQSRTSTIVQGADAVVVDARNPAHGGGGSGMLSDWEYARILQEQGRQVVLAGGLTPENIAAAVAHVRPWAVDVSSGVEAEPGKKDSRKTTVFIRSATSAFAAGGAGKEETV